MLTAVGLANNIYVQIGLVLLVVFDADHVAAEEVGAERLSPLWRQPEVVAPAVFRIATPLDEPLNETFVTVKLADNPDKKGRKLVNVNHIVSIDWYTK